MFDIHKIKPVHGWRELFGEIGIIVVGVLIALTCEQVVDALHWRHTVDRSIEALKAEASSEYGWAVEWRVVDPCIEGQIDALKARLLRSGSVNVPAPVYSEVDFRSYVIRVPDRTHGIDAWTAANSDGVASHFKADRRRFLEAAYSLTRSIETLNNQNEAAYQRLLSLSAPIPLDPSARLSLLDDLNQLQGRVDLMSLQSGQLIARLSQAGMSPSSSVARSAVAGSGTRRFCTNNGFPLRDLDEAERAIAPD